MADEFDTHADREDILPPQAEPSLIDILYDQPSDESEDREERPARPGGELFEWLQMIMGCILVAVLMFNCFARLTRVDGGSMDNTLQDGELMLVWGLGYQPEAGDIVVVNKKTADFLSNRAIVKRVIALGGQTVDVDYATNTIYVDGVPLEEEYLHEPMYLPTASTMQGTHFEVPEGSIFVMGDNRNASSDSRDIRLGCVDEGYLLGKVVLGLWPVSKFGLM